MLGLFPKLYPDELIYSVLARYYVRSGYSNYVFAAEDLFQNRYVRPSFDYVSPLNDEVISYLREIDNMQNVLLRHTMFPYHCRFLPMERKNKTMQELINMGSNFRNIILFPRRTKTPSMRYCPLCAADERKNYGETYWHRLHQIYELPVCPVHKCFLVNTDYKLSGNLPPNLIPAEMVIPLSENIILCDNEKLLLLAGYIKEIFDLPIKLDMDLSVSDILKRITENTMYRTPRGEVCRISALYKDFEEFYQAIVENIPKQWQIHKVITGQRYDFWEIVLLAFFLEINTFELQRAKDAVLSQNNIFDDQIRKLHESGLSYPQIATQMGLPLNTIKNAVYSKTKRPKRRQKRGGKPGRRQFDWQAMDKDMLPKVVETIAELKSSEKPQKITVGGVARLVGLKSKQIDKLSLCKTEIMRNCQSQEVFWAQKVLWAWSIISREGRSKSVKQVRLITNMSTDQIRRCMSDLEKKNIEVFTEISKII